MAPSRIVTQEDIGQGLVALAALDGRLCTIMEKAGRVPLRRRAPGFEGLAAIIVSQMVSRASADAILGRLTAKLAGAITPAALLALDDAAHREIGLSRAKRATLQRAALACLERRIDLEALCDIDARRAIDEMTAIKGIGPWTAEVYLLFCAGHPDIFPAGDLALQHAAHHALGLETRPDARALRMIAEGWAPWRGVAARLLWAHYGRFLKRGVLPLAA